VFADVFFQTVGALAWSSVLLGVLAWVSAWNGVLPVALWFVVAVDALLFLVAWGLPIGKPFSLRAPSVRAQAVVGAFALLSFCLFLAFAGGSLDSVRPVFFGSTDSVLNVVQVDAMVGSGSLGLPLFLNASGEAAFSVWTPFVSLTAPAFSGALGGLNGFDSIVFFVGLSYVVFLLVLFGLLLQWVGEWHWYGGQSIVYFWCDTR
jgi:hypothetical protein